MEKEELFYLSMKEWQRQVRIKKTKEFVKSIPQKMKKVWDEDKELVLFLAPGVVYVVRSLTKIKSGKKEDYHRNCQIYDQSLGMWHDLRKPMSVKQKTEFAARRKNGESVLNILTSMGLLKR